jgi:hypothetical protein
LLLLPGVAHRRLATAGLSFPMAFPKGEVRGKRCGGSGVVIADGRHWFPLKDFSKERQTCLERQLQRRMFAQWNRRTTP